VKVALVETGGWGGIAHYAWSLCAALADAGAEVWLLTNAAYELDDLPRRFDVAKCFTADAGYFGNVRALRAGLARARPDVVHVQSLISTRFDALLWPLVRRRVPLVMTMHNVRSHERIRWDDWTLWRCLRTADAVVAHTQEALGLGRRRLGPRARIELIRMGDWGVFEGTDAVDRREARAVERGHRVEHVRDHGVQLGRVEHRHRFRFAIQQRIAHLEHAPNGQCCLLSPTTW